METATHSDEAFVEEVRAFVRAEVPETVREKVVNGVSVDATERRAWHRALYERGWVAPHWPVEHGGAGWPALRAFLFNETLAEEGAPDLGTFGLKMLGPLLIRFGSDAQRRRYLPPLLAGDDFWCQGFSEPGSGSDLTSLKTRAERDGGEWVINGQKIWTTMAHEANRMFALVRTDRDAPKPRMGLSILLVDMDTPGITVRPVILLNGNRHTNEVFFDNVRVPAGNLVGEVNQGWTYSRALLGTERLSIARVGWNKRQFAHLKRVAEAEGALRSPLIAARIAEAEIALMTLEAMVKAMIERARAWETPGVEANMLKIKGSELQQRLAELLVEIAGPRAAPFQPDRTAPGQDWTAHSFANHFYGRVASIYGGSNEIQRNIIARALGLGHTS
ncbi:MAG TPA: acyl-CoA dehydrogenase family protein [Sphingomonadaceae bacterium]|nr:acyl-CoA dehydrogenase family protein [Sphingomonadaceae bacterium]